MAQYLHLKEVWRNLGVAGRVAMVAGAVVIVCFFLPWGNETAGYEVPGLIGDMESHSFADLVVDTYVQLLYLVPVLAVLGMIAHVQMGERGRVLARVSGVVNAVIMAPALVGYVCFIMQAAVLRGFNAKGWGGTGMAGATLGAYGMLLATFLRIGWTQRKTPQDVRLQNLSAYLLLPKASAPHRAATTVQLGECGKAAIPLLEQLVQDEDEDVRQAAEEALKNIRAAGKEEDTPK